MPAEGGDHGRPSSEALAELGVDTTLKKPKPSWLKFIFGIGAQHGDTPAVKMIYPLSYFGVAWLGVTGSSGALAIALSINNAADSSAATCTRPLPRMQLFLLIFALFHIYTGVH
jgi:hypothetical protein